MTNFDVLIIGASASGLMCAIEAAKRGRKVLVVDHASKAGKKIRISGGGRCNFSNYDVTAGHYLSENKHFCKSALARYQYYDFLSLLAEYDIPWHEREHGQLFCDRSANDIVQMLLSECRRYAITIQLNCKILAVRQLMENTSGFLLDTQINLPQQSLQAQSFQAQSFQAQSLVIATGGLSVSKMGASDFGLRLAKQFKINCVATRPGLVPLTYSAKDIKKYKALSGIALLAEVSFADHRFKEDLLFTHKGISGPVVLQISSYWQAELQQAVHINLLPELDLYNWLQQMQHQQAKVLLKNIMAQKIPRRLADCLCQIHALDKPVNQYNNVELKNIAQVFQNWSFWPTGTEGYRVAEVTIGGVDTHEISSKTMQANKVKGLYFIGEVLDVAGHLGGYNFQWAWASGYTAGQFV